VYLACLLHDVAKPTTTRIEEGGRVTAHGRVAFVEGFGVVVTPSLSRGTPHVADHRRAPARASRRCAVVT